ncbi:MAG: A24 family peptidase [Synechococcales cyanobacterium]
MDTWVWWPTVILVGAAVGSFLNVVVYRIPQGLSVWSPPSQCPSCHTPLTAKDNIPVLGWWLLRGRCRYCQAPISWRYPLVESLCLGLFALCFWVVDWQPQLAVAWLFVTWLLALALIDADTGYLPEVLTRGGVVAGAIIRLVQPWWVGSGSLTASLSSLLMGIAAAVLGIWLLEGLRGLWLLVRHKEALGLGDGKLLAGIGMVLGWWPGVILTVILASVSGLVVTVVRWLWQRATAKTWDQPLPFGPHLAVGGCLAFLFGEAWVEHYWQWLLGL